MKREATISLSIAVAAFAILLPQFAQAKTTSGTQSSMPQSRQEAMKMVPAQVSLTKDLDARRMQPGHAFRAKLNKDVRLDNGTELPHGTVLIGTVVTDKMQVAGKSRLALRFTKAQLKSGKVIPIKATIMGIAPPAYDAYENPTADDLGQWNHKTLQLDQIGALSGIDLHSKISSKNSGVFVSTKKDDVKLSAGSRMALAIAQRNS